MLATKIPETLAREIEAHDFICGSDEVGYGSWAGPLVVCAAIVARDWVPPALVRDSKQLTPARRESAFESIVGTVVHHLVAVEVEEIDRRGVGTVIIEAHLKALLGAIEAHKALGLGGKVLTIVDGSLPIHGATCLPKADALVPAVSAASIIAKVTRDRHMKQMDVKYPGYSFASNSGYGTQDHREALDRLGVTPIHRKSYAPIAALTTTDNQPREAWFGLDEDA